tara:strand:- start:502 stop:1173 length:672 start_codon:yes stop_codon:yes gene_type:complete
MIRNLSGTLALAGALLLASTASQAATVNGFANGGFEDATGNVAAGWVGAAQGYTISKYSYSGENALRLQSPAINSAVALQNSVDDGGMPPLTPGDNPIFSFWMTGEQGSLGVVNYALRYLDSVGNILADSQAQEIGHLISWDEWTYFSYDLGVVPDGTTSAFIEFSQAIGPIGTGPAGEEWTAGIVIIDDVYLGVEASVVPLPAAAWLFGSALIALVGIKRRK